MAPGGEDFQVDPNLYALDNHTIAVSALFPNGRGIDRPITFEGVGTIAELIRPFYHGDGVGETGQDLCPSGAVQRWSH